MKVTAPQYVNALFDWIEEQVCSWNYRSLAFMLVRAAYSMSSVQTCSRLMTAIFFQARLEALFLVALRKLWRKFSSAYSVYMRTFITHTFMRSARWRPKRISTPALNTSFCLQRYACGILNHCWQWNILVQADAFAICSIMIWWTKRNWLRCKSSLKNKRPAWYLEALEMVFYISTFWLAYASLWDVRRCIGQRS